MTTAGFTILVAVSPASGFPTTVPDWKPQTNLLRPTGSTFSLKPCGLRKYSPSSKAYICSGKARRPETWRDIRSRPDIRPLRSHRIRRGKAGAGSCRYRTGPAKRRRGSSPKARRGGSKAGGRIAKRAIQGHNELGGSGYGARAARYAAKLVQTSGRIRGPRSLITRIRKAGPAQAGPASLTNLQAGGERWLREVAW